MPALALLDFARLRERPRWIAPLAIAAFVSGAMPAVHRAVFGPDLIAHAVVTQIGADAHLTIGPEGEQRIRDGIVARPLGASVVLVGAVAALLILTSAVVLNIATLLVGADIAAGQALSVASVAACVETLLRAAMFAGAVLAIPPEQVVALDWTRVGRSNLAFLEGLGQTVRWTTLVSSVDVVTIVSVAVAAYGLMAMDTKLSAWRAALAASAWPVIGIAARVLIAGAIGMPLR
jgi:hypothetical protein